jgi:hypothetical protein
MKFTIEHAQKVAAKLYDEPQARCVDHCEACDALEAGWEYNVSQVLAALKVLEGEE